MNTLARRYSSAEVLSEVDEHWLAEWDRENDSLSEGRQAERVPSPTAANAVHGTAAGPLTLKAISEYCWRSECERYFVASSYAPDLDRPIFLASFKPSPASPAESISELRRESFDDAVADCVAHFNRQHK